jgi:Spy/CpxP family protein refolding chaperone
MKSLPKIILGASICLALTATSAIAGGWGHDRGERGGGPCGMGAPGGLMNPHMMDKLDFTDDQEAKLKATHQAKRSQMEVLRAEREKLDKALIDALSQTPIDIAKVNQAKAGLIEWEKKQLDQRVEMETTFMNLLTPAQHKKFNEFMVKMQEKKAKHDKEEREERDEEERSEKK